MPRLHIEITLRDDLSETRMIWFEGLHIQSMENGSTCLSGDVTDDPALFGLLERVRDLNLHLATVQVKPICEKGK
jgi:hypothetical protein